MEKERSCSDGDLCRWLDSKVDVLLDWKDWKVDRIKGR